ncbi:3-phosphoshikimate 1-carboxyvinyltransferase [Nakamurella aerolata]|uniref:3-phosphoshikimate 1-carboxyvinyltransferase n=1 Tax=Nakamurella aerolata TaxID=1656892 RepID=A0A849AAP1_9ACTN|nr:3-phosphoshikimate 1-carboxyvinyltransferase [Nakamurella aerolata]NNG36656.1 3-phosphoshikimate 1-carboxyvinyltransferase [Nakamurella aerolata]
MSSSLTAAAALRDWPAPVAAGAVNGTVSVPGSKSLSNRALILAAQATAPSVLEGVLRSRDSALMAAGLRALGVPVDDSGPDWAVTPAPLRGPAQIDTGLAGTVMRFLPPLAATADGAVTVDGDPAARKRPMGEILRALRVLGVEIDGSGLPFTLQGKGFVTGGSVTIDASASSQFVSGLLLAAPSFRRGLTVQHDGTPVPSLPHIEMTVQALRSVGVQVDDSDPNTWTVVPGPVDPWTQPIETDLSNATPFLAAALVIGGTVRIPRWPEHTTQPGAAFADLAADLGADVTLRNGTLSVTGPDRLPGMDIDAHDFSELAPTLAAVAALADGPSHLRGIGHIRGHETDRLAALVDNITGLGGDADADADALHIRPARLYGGTWRAFADHRMATAGAIIGLRVAGVVVDDIDCTAKTLPGFAAMWADLLGDRDGSGS